MASAPQDPKPGPPRQPSPPPVAPWIWLLILGTLLAWNVMSFWPRSTPEIEIPYTTFLNEVRGDNVSAVSVSGAKITGSFTKAWTPPAHTSKAAPAKAGETAPAKTAESKTPAAKTRTKPTPQSYTHFHTTFPDAIGDPRLLPLLEDHHVTVEATPPASHWMLDLLIGWLPMLLLIGFFVWMGRKAGKNQGGLFGFGRTKARRYSSASPKVTFNDVAGADEAKEELQEVVDFLRHPGKYHALGARIPRGVLLAGPPGTGKTLLARAVAGEADVPFFSIGASEFVEMFVGVGASRVRDLFTQAKVEAPAIVFIDELDAVGRRRGAGVGMVNDEREQTLNQLLMEMDGFDERQEVIVLAASNRPDVLDPALLRPGRFDRQVVVGLPDRRGREGILRIHTRELRLLEDVDLSVLARTTTGLSGADLANLCNEAALVAARHDRAQISMADFEEAQDKILLGGVRPLLLDAHERRVVAFHESGHALVAWLTPSADPVHKVTIVPRGRALGVTEQLPGEDRYNYSYTYLKSRLAVMLGGRVAEEIALGDVTTGAESDLVEATRLARRMVTRWGMGELGLAAFKADGQQPFLGYELSQGRDYSEATAAHIDREVQRILKDSHDDVQRLLGGARDKLDRLVEVLLKEETVARAELTEILGPRPDAPS
jgi:cell division protease FtsH